MASFERRCPDCHGNRSIPSDASLTCRMCGGAGHLRKPIPITVQIRVDNRPPAPFVLTIHPDGTMDFRPVGKRSRVSTHVQNVFNLARKESAQADIASTRQRKTVTRGLLALEREAKRK